jgi:hypothetical protein
VADDNRPLSAQLQERLVEQFGLLRGCPQAPARALAIPEAWTVEDNNTVRVQQKLGNATRVPVVACHGVPVDQHDRATGAPVAIVQPDAIHHEERALGRMLALGTAPDSLVRHSEAAEGNRAGNEGALPP